MRRGARWEFGENRREGEEGWGKLWSVWERNENKVNKIKRNFTLGCQFRNILFCSVCVYLWV